jgi:lipoprotein-releasing system permease protein
MHQERQKMSVFNWLKLMRQSLPFELFVGMRYTRAKRRNHFISFISFISMVGIETWGCLL